MLSVVGNLNLISLFSTILQLFVVPVLSCMSMCDCIEINEKNRLRFMYACTYLANKVNPDSDIHVWQYPLLLALFVYQRQLPWINIKVIERHQIEPKGTFSSAEQAAWWSKAFQSASSKVQSVCGQGPRFLTFLDGSERVRERFPSAEVRVCFTALQLTFSPGAHPEPTLPPDEHNQLTAQRKTIII